MRVWWSGGVSVVATLAVAAAGGCTTKMLEPDLDVWAGIGIQMMALYDRSDGFWWQDPDVWDSKDDVGVITIAGNQLTAAGGICGRPDWGDCGATFAPPVVEVSVPDGPNAPSIVYHLERVAGALEVRDAADAVLISLQPTAGGADIYDGEGLLRDVAHWDQDDSRRLWVSTGGNALIGWSIGAVPPEIGALAQGAILATETHPSVPGHAIVIAAALTWLR